MFSGGDTVWCVLLGGDNDVGFQEYCHCVKF